MKDYFDFETAITCVKSKKTQKYLKEVLSTYYNKEYRSCIIMLYATTFFDSLEKIKIMSEELLKCQKRFPNIMLTFIHKKVQIHYIAYLLHKGVRHGTDLIFLCSSLKNISLFYKINMSS